MRWELDNCLTWYMCNCEMAAVMVYYLDDLQMSEMGAVQLYQMGAVQLLELGGGHFLKNGYGTVV